MVTARPELQMQNLKSGLLKAPRGLARIPVRPPNRGGFLAFPFGERILNSRSRRRADPQSGPAAELASLPQAQHGTMLRRPRRRDAVRRHVRKQHP
jgi:hypothetical protein